MNSQILNREFQHPTDGWYEIEAKGEHPNRAAGVVQVLDDAACAAIVNRFNADAAAGKLSHGAEMLIDHEHFKHDPNQETRAYGWLARLQDRNDGIYGKIRWTGSGKQAVDNGDYRFFSTEYDPADLQHLSGGNPLRVRPLRLDGLTLTNSPNNKGQRPITNRAGGVEACVIDWAIADKALVSKIANRAADLRAKYPHLSLGAAYRWAQQEYLNRQQVLNRATPEKFLADKISNRANAIRGGNSRISLATAYSMAQREFGCAKSASTKRK